MKLKIEALRNLVLKCDYDFFVVDLLVFGDKWLLIISVLCLMIDPIVWINILLWGFHKYMSAPVVCGTNQNIQSHLKWKLLYMHG